MDEFVAEIALATKEQSTGIGQINQAVGQMDRVTQTNAASSEELSAQAVELKNAVQQLVNLIGEKQTVTPPDAPERTHGNGRYRRNIPNRAGADHPKSFLGKSNAGPKRELSPPNLRQTAEEKIPMEGDFRDF